MEHSLLNLTYDIRHFSLLTWSSILASLSSVTLVSLSSMVATVSLMFSIASKTSDSRSNGLELWQKFQYVSEISAWGKEKLTKT